MIFEKIERSPIRNPVFPQSPRLPLYKEKQEIFPKLQKVFGFTSGKGEKFGLGQEKSPKIKKVPKYLELIERFHIFAPSKHKFWLSG